MKPVFARYLKLSVLAGLGLAVPGLAWGQNYDIAAHCSEQAEITGSHSNFLELSCRKQEIAARDALQRMSIDPQIREHCAETVSIMPTGSYWLFKACVDQEINAARQLGR